MSRPYSYVRQRTQQLRGETDYSNDATTQTIDGHIIAAIEDICNMFPFSWNVTQGASQAVTASAFSSVIGTFNLPANYNPLWKLEDLRVFGGGNGLDTVYTPIPYEDMNAYGTGSSSITPYGYFILPNPLTGIHAVYLTGFNLPVPARPVPTYHFTPSALIAETDLCIVPDVEAVAYLAASKNWVGDERNQELKADYETEAKARVQAMYNNDLIFGPVYTQGSIVDMNPHLLG